MQVGSVIAGYRAKTAGADKEKSLIRQHWLIAGLQVKEPCIGKTKPISFSKTSVGHCSSFYLGFPVLIFTLLDV